MVGVFGLGSRYIFYNWQYLALSTAGLPRGATIAVVFATLLWPTFWMGVSLPVLGRAVTIGLDVAARRVGILYGLNTAEFAHVLNSFPLVALMDREAARARFHALS